MSTMGAKQRAVTPPGPVMLDLLDSLDRSCSLPLTVPDLVADTGRAKGVIQDALHRLKLRGLATPTHGGWMLTEDAE